MSGTSWLEFARAFLVLAFLVLALIPGPGVLLVVGQALSRGLRAAMACTLGQVAGGSLLVLMSLLGVGAVVSASVVLFWIVKWLGVAYLAWLGVRQIRSARSQSAEHDPGSGAGERAKDRDRDQARYGARDGANRSFTAGFLTALLNLKSIVFYMAFFSQFMDPGAAHWPQYFMFMATAGALGGLVLVGYVLIAGQARHTLINPARRRAVHYVSGGFYTGGSAAMAVTR